MEMAAEAAGESMAALARRIFDQPVPHIEALGIVLVERLPRGVILRLPYRAELVGNPDDGALHGGAVVTLIDTACGFAAMASLPRPGAVATLDLRVDYLRSARAGADLLARAECYRLTRRVAFCRAAAYNGDPEQPVAAALGTFMVAEPDPGGRPGGAQDGGVRA